MTIKSLPTYIFSLSESPGSVLAKNHVVIHNPTGSGKVMFLSAFFGSHVALATSVLTAPLRGLRCSGTPSGGLLEEAAATCKFIPAHPDPTAQVFTGNPTVTLGAPFLNSPASVDKRTSAVHGVDAPLPFAITPGNGVVFRQEAFSVDISWNISVIWRES